MHIRNQGVGYRKFMFFNIQVINGIQRLQYNYGVNLCKLMLQV